MPQLVLGLGAQIKGSNSFDPDALRYFTTAGVTDATGRSQINTFVRGIKSLGLYNNMVCWPLRSTQNAGTGTTAYSLGGLGVYNGTLTNGPTWGTGGITFDGTNDYIPTGFTGALPAFTVFSIATPLNTGAIGTEVSKDNISTSREFGLLTPYLGNHYFYVFNPTVRDINNITYQTTIKSICARASSTVFKYRKNNETDFSDTSGALTTGSSNLTIGATTGGASSRFYGTIHASILFNTALTDSQTSAVYALYQTSLGAGLGLPDADASAYIARAGVTDATGQQQINDFVVGVKNLGLYNNMVAWPLRSTQNAGTGTTAYSLGGLGTYDGTLTNGPTWGTSGITFDGVDDYIDTTLGTVQPELTAISVTTPSATTSAVELSKSNAASSREFEIVQISSLVRLVTTGADGVNTRIGPSAAASECKFICGRMSSSFRRLRKNNGSDFPDVGSTRASVGVNVRIGAYTAASLAPFPGVIHSSIIFNKALTDSETSSMYTLYSTTLGSGLGLP